MILRISLVEFNSGVSLPNLQITFIIFESDLSTTAWRKLENSDFHQFFSRLEVNQKALDFS